MASAELREELTCSICLHIYTDPVSLRCGHSFCHACIGSVLDHQFESTGICSCPECREEYPNRPSLEKNRKLCNIARQVSITSSPPDSCRITCTYCVHTPIAAAKTCLQCETSLCDHHLSIHNSVTDHVLTDPINSIESRKCLEHKKLLEYHCSHDGALICVSCFAVGSHREHQVETLDEAMAKKKKRLRNLVEELGVRSRDVEKRVRNLLEVKRSEQEKVTDTRQKCNLVFEDARNHLDLMKAEILSLIDKQEEKMSSRISRMIKGLETKTDLLSEAMGNAEAICAMNDPLVVLQNKDMDSKGSSGNLMATISEDNPNIRFDQGLVLVSLHAALSNFTNKVKKAVYVPETTDLSLDVDTATSNVLISGDRKSASWMDAHLSHPVNSKRFVSYCQVLGKESFYRGQHYWEVMVSESEYWTVGLAYDSIAREGEGSRIGYNESSWCLNRSGNGYHMIHNWQGSRLNTKPPMNKIGVYLDYEAGRLAFYQLCDPIRHLHTFTAKFTKPLHPAFVLWKDVWIRMKS